MKKAILFLFSFLCYTYLSAQPIPQRQWHRFYGGSGREQFTTLSATSDGGCIFAAQTASNDGLLSGHRNPNRKPGREDTWIVKLNVQGDTLWTLTLNGRGENTSSNRINAIIELPDHGFMLAGVGLTSPNTFVPTRARLIKVTATGRIVWDKAFLTDRNDIGLNLGGSFSDGIPTADGGFMACGVCRSELLSGGSQTDDVWLVKVDGNGAKQSEKIYKLPGSEMVPSIVPLASGGFLIGSNLTFFVGTTVSKAQLLRVDTAGELVNGWPFILEKDNASLLSRLLVALDTTDQTIILSEHYQVKGTPTMPGQNIVRVSKVDTNRTIAWQKEFPIDGNSGPRGLQLVSDRRILIGTFTGPDIDPCNIITLQLWDTNGNVLYKLSVSRQSALGIRVGRDGGFFLINENDSNNQCLPDLPNNAKQDIYVAKYCPTAQISYRGSTTLCQGESLPLSANPIPGATFQWLKDGQPITGATGPSFLANEAGSYAVSMRYETCSSTSSNIAITIKPLPQATITAPGNTDVCEGTTIDLQANAGTGFTYQWKKNGTVVAGATGASFTATVSGGYSVVVSSDGCFQESSAIQIQMNPAPNAVVTSNSPVHCLQTIRLTAQPDGMNYQWQGPNGFNSTAQNPRRCLATKRKLGVYTLTVANPANGCRKSVSTEVIFRKPSS